MTAHRRSGPPEGSAAPELIESGFTLENADAPFLHAGLNLADIAHVLDLLRRGIVPPAAARDLLRLLLEVQATDAAQFPYEPEFGEPYNSRERFFVSRLGDAAAGCTRAGLAGKRRGSHCGSTCGPSCSTSSTWSSTSCADRGRRRAASRHADARPDLPAASPALDVGHYVLSFAYPAVRDAERLLDEFGAINRSPGGAGCVNGTRLLDDRDFVARALGFDGVIEHTRDAMWQIDGLIHVLATAASLLSTQSKLAEDLEIWSSSEFDFVDLADAYTRSSILMPQKRNPYSLAIVRGASGVLIGRLTGFLAVAKSPSARSDNLIFAYGEVPRALDLVDPGDPVDERRHGHTARQRRSPRGGTRRRLHPGHRPDRVHRADLRRRLPQRVRRGRQDSTGGQPTRHRRKGHHRSHARRGGPRRDRAFLGSRTWTWLEALDARAIVATRVGVGGAAPSAVRAMIAQCEQRAADIQRSIDERRQRLEQAERQLLADAARTAREATR